MTHNKAFVPTGQAAVAAPISPSGSREKLELTREIIAVGPDVPGWTLLPAKPPKNEKRRSFWFKGHRITTVDWLYGIIKWQDPVEYGVTWVPNEVLTLPEQHIPGLGWFILESEIGEEAALELYDHSEIAYETKLPTTEIEFFREHFHKLRQDDV